jgi:hypothetical protein
MSLRHSSCVGERNMQINQLGRFVDFPLAHACSACKSATRELLVLAIEVCGNCGSCALILF